MRLVRVILPTRDLDAVERFYRDALELPTRRDADGRLVVTAGSSALVFVTDPSLVGHQHLAFMIPTGSVPAARTWLEQRARLLDRDGEIEIEGPPGWDSRSLYFDGPDGQVLELIEHRALRQPRQDSFGPSDLLLVVEVGIAVSDVAAAVDALSTVGALPFANPPAQDFAAVGDLEGMLILAAPGRVWMPTRDRVAAPSTVVIRSDVSSPVDLDEGRIRIVPTSD